MRRPPTRPSRWNGQLELAERGQQGCEDPVCSARLALLRAEVLIPSNELGAAERLILGARDAALGDEKLHARWLYIDAYLASRRDPDDALTRLELARRAAAEAPAPGSGVDAANLQGSLWLAKDDLAAAERYWREALALAVQIDDGFRIASVLNNLGMTRYRSGRWDEAIEFFERARRPLQQAGGAMLLPMIEGNLSGCWYEIGDMDAAIEARRRSVEAMRRLGYPRWLCEGLGLLGQLERARGDTPASLRSLREAVDMARELDESLEIVEWSVQLARSLVAAGDVAGAGDWIMLARETLERLQEQEGSGSWPHLRGGLLLAEGERSAGSGELAAALACFKKALETVSGDSAMAWQAHAASAAVERRAGRPEAARASHAAAVAGIESGRDRLSLESRLSFLTRPIRVYQDWVALLLELGREAEALQVVERSRARTLVGEPAARDWRDVDGGRLVDAARRHGVVLLC